MSIADEVAQAARLMAQVAQDHALLESVEAVIGASVRSLSGGGKLLLAGNGGSAADCQHIAAELVGRFLVERAALPAIALTTDTSILTAVGNDYGFDYLFARQVEALGRRGDVLVAYSTSGNSANIVRALQTARERGLTTIGMTGNRNGRMNALCDHLVAVPSSHTPNVQEVHLVLGHAICNGIERALLGGPDPARR